jgi:hypothetical protein
MQGEEPEIEVRSSAAGGVLWQHRGKTSNLVPNPTSMIVEGSGPLA